LPAISAGKRASILNYLYAAYKAAAKIA